MLQHSDEYIGDQVVTLIKARRTLMECCLISHRMACGYLILFRLTSLHHSSILFKSSLTFVYASEIFSQGICIVEALPFADNLYIKKGHEFYWTSIRNSITDLYLLSSICHIRIKKEQLNTHKQQIQQTCQLNRLILFRWVFRWNKNMYSNLESFRYPVWRRLCCPSEERIMSMR